MRYVVRNNFFGLELQGRAQDQQAAEDEQAERQRASPSRGEEIRSVGDSCDKRSQSERKEAVAGDENCLRQPQGDRLCAEPSGEPAHPQASGQEAADKGGHVTCSSNIYDDEIWESPGAAM